MVLVKKLLLKSRLPFEDGSLHACGLPLLAQLLRLLPDALGVGLQGLRAGQGCGGHGFGAALAFALAFVLQRLFNGLQGLGVALFVGSGAVFSGLCSGQLFLMLHGARQRREAGVQQGGNDQLGHKPQGAPAQAAEGRAVQAAVLH